MADLNISTAEAQGKDLKTIMNKIEALKQETNKSVKEIQEDTV